MNLSAIGNDTMNINLVCVNLCIQGYIPNVLPIPY